MPKTRIAIVGYGNVGKGVHKALKHAPDMTLVGVITRNLSRVRDSNLDTCIFSVDDALKGKVQYDVAILCGGSARDLPEQTPQFARIGNIVDSFDTHVDIDDKYNEVRSIGELAKTTGLISGGWDPGWDSVIRALNLGFIPGATLYTFWGRGVSQGHSDAARQVPGVADARAYTIPIAKAMKLARSGKNPDLGTREKHKREVFVVTMPGVNSRDRKDIERRIKTMPKYFADYDTKVKFISKEEMDKNHSEMPHGGSVIATGYTSHAHFDYTLGRFSSKDQKAVTEFRCRYGSNPEATGSILVACARAVNRLHKEGRFGAFTMLDVPPAYYLNMTGQELRKTIM